MSGEFFANAGGAGAFTCGATTNTVTITSSSASEPLYFGSPMEIKPFGLILYLK